MSIFAAKYTRLLHREFEQHFRSLFPLDYEWFVDAMNETPAVSIRVNPTKWLGCPFSECGPVPWFTGAYYLPSRPAFYADPLHHAGAYYVQDASTMFFANAIDWTRPMLALDLCAAPGGKSTLLLDRLAPGSFLVSNEADLNRSRALVENLGRWGRHNVLVTNAVVKSFLPMGPMFDLVLVDAPCSGEGMFRKDVRALEQWSPNFVSACAAVQQPLLAQAATLVAPGGYLVYSTCTYEPMENEAQIAGILDKMPEYEVVTTQCHPGWGVDQVDIPTVSEPLKGYYLYHHRVRGEGQFVCVIRRREEGLRARIPGKPAFSKPSKQEAENILAMVPAPMNTRLVKVRGHIHALPSEHESLASFCHSLMPLWKLGVDMGTVSANNVRPGYEAALHCESVNRLPMFELGLPQALDYLKGGPLPVHPQWPKGWGLACFKGLALGWGKNVGTRLNNYLPRDRWLRKEVVC
ncbi:MAG: hypothetical protein HYZ16_12135 [Bacteroidetes bacterium]|nr:hypothetical protein [Bacteroidota bacterium]